MINLHRLFVENWRTTSIGFGAVLSAANTIRLIGWEVLDPIHSAGFVALLGIAVHAFFSADSKNVSNLRQQVEQTKSDVKDMKSDVAAVEEQIDKQE